MTYQQLMALQIVQKQISFFNSPLPANKTECDMHCFLSTLMVLGFGHMWKD